MLLSDKSRKHLKLQLKQFNVIKDKWDLEFMP